jgi:hypothetical protein
MCSGLVVIGDFDVVCVIGYGVPCKTDAVLLVDADAVLSGAVAGEQFEVIAWRLAKRINIRRAVYSEKAKNGAMSDVRREPMSHTMPESFCLFICE